MRRWIDRLLPTRPSADEPHSTRVQEVRLPFSEVEGTLALYVTALSDGTLRVSGTAGAMGGSYSDGRTIFFPSVVTGFDNRADARRLYRVMAAWKVLQVRSGALDVEALINGEQAGHALGLYEVLHGEWLDRQLIQRWPGLTNDLLILRADALQRLSADGATNGHAQESLLRHLLAQPLNTFPSRLTLEEQIGISLPNIDEALSADDVATVRRTVLQLAASVPSIGEGAFMPVHYRGRIRYDQIRIVTSVDFEEEQHQQSALAPRRAKSRHDPLVVDVRSPEQMNARDRRATRGGRQSVQLSMGDREPTMTFQQVPLSDAEKAGALLYDEWDHRINAYQTEWCAVRLRHPKGGSTEAVDRILRQNAPLIARIKQQFEALRPERTRLTRQLDGDELDLDAIVDAHADRYAGFSPSDKLYSRILERERNIALGVLVDLSGSTGAWIDDDPRNDQVIEVTRRAIVFLCEALTMLDDRYAVYGFTSSTRKRIDVAILKAFDEQYTQTVKGRVAGMAPGSYTRIGPAVRHVTQALLQQPARIRLLLMLSDGRPNDFDGYGGRYGIEDTRKALLDARQKGVATFALTIDSEGRDYLPHMFGRNHYVVVEDIRALSFKLSDVYRRLTVQ